MIDRVVILIAITGWIIATFFLFFGAFAITHLIGGF